MFAEAKTSAGAPCRIWAASAFEPANEKRACGAIFGKASVSEAAAKTVGRVVSTWAAAVPATTAAARTASANLMCAPPSPRSP